MFSLVRSETSICKPGILDEQFSEFLWVRESLHLVMIHLWRSHRVFTDLMASVTRHWFGPVKKRATIFVSSHGYWYKS